VGMYSSLPLCWLSSHNLHRCALSCLPS
jgi:hypothetical protein